MEPRDIEGGDIVEIEAKQVNEVHKTLRFHKSPDVSMKAQLAELKKKIDRIAHIITSYSLFQMTSRRAYSSVFKPAVEFVLISSYMTKGHLDKAQVKSTRSFLKAMGYNLYFPRTVVYAPK